MATERIISADSHVNPPKDLWTRDVPERLRDRAPRGESTEEGGFWGVASGARRATLRGKASPMMNRRRVLMTRATNAAAHDCVHHATANAVETAPSRKLAYELPHSPKLGEFG